MKIEEFLKIRNDKNIVKKEKMQLEGDEFDIYNVYRNSQIIYAVEPTCEKDCKVWRVWVYSKDFKTKEGIGVGNTLADLKKRYTVKEISAEGEGSIAVLVKEINIAFFLDSSKIPEPWWDHQSIKSLNDNILITMIVIS